MSKCHHFPNWLELASCDYPQEEDSEKNGAKAAAGKKENEEKQHRGGGGKQELKGGKSFNLGAFWESFQASKGVTFGPQNELCEHLVHPYFSCSYSISTTRCTKKLNIHTFK